MLLKNRVFSFSIIPFVGFCFVTCFTQTTGGSSIGPVVRKLKMPRKNNIKFMLPTLRSDKEHFAICSTGKAGDLGIWLSDLKGSKMKERLLEKVWVN